LRFALLGALSVLVFVFAVGPAEAQLTRGIISGTVRDASGAVVPGATVTITNMDTNISRTAVTSELGFYRVAALEPGRYVVRTELSGFSTVEQKDIPVKAALEATVNVEMSVAGVGEALTVVGKAEAVELNKSNPTIGMTSTGRQAVELPLSAARNINNLALLSPNVFTGPGSTEISTNGQRARNNNFMIDGSDNNDISVTLPTTPMLPEAVAEFQIQTNPYNVEFGRNSGAQINVITKGGTNAFHGEVWDYYRTAGFNALDNLEKVAGLEEPARSVRHQMGLTFGGPIIRDKTFFFGAFQRDTLRTGEVLGATVRIPTPTGFAALQNVPLRAGQPTSSRQAVLQRLAFLQDMYATNPSFRNLTTVLVNGVPIQTGQVNFGRFRPQDINFFTGRLDHRFGASDTLTLRYTRNPPETTNLISNCDFGATFCGNQIVEDQNAQLSETHIFSPQILNEFRFSYIRRDLAFPENDPDSPTGQITGLFTIGGLNNFPQGRIQNSYQFSDVLTWQTGKHNFKFGADIRRIILDNQAAFDSKGTFTFNNLQDFMNNTAATYAQALQTSSFTAKQWQTYLFAQDDYRVTPDLTLNIGLRYEIATAPLGFFGATDAESLGALVPGPAQKDTNNWAPRIGFNWSPRSDSKILGNGKSVFRGGYGITYDVLFYNILTVNASNYPRVVVPTLQNVFDVYPNTTSVSGAPVFNPLATYVNSPENLQHPMTHIFSFDFQREIGRDWIVALGYVGSRSHHGVNQQQANPAILTPAQIATVQATRSSTSIPAVQARRLFPQYGARILIPSDEGPNGVDAEARAHYDGGYITVSKRLSRGLQFQASYTLSRLNSNNDESLGVADITGSSPQIPQDYFDIEAEWGPSVFDRTHRFVVNYIWEVPGPKSGALRQILGGWQLSGVTQMQSGQPFTVVTGVDTNGNGGGGDRPNLGSGTLTWDDDHKNFTNNGKYVAFLGTNLLPLANSMGNGNGPVRGERGPGFWQTDLSILKRFFIGQTQLVIRGDLLNAFNQDNYGNPVAAMNNPSFGQNTRDWGERTVTLSAKFIW
jgi:outer membrane receptor protein involved in Fe transport